MSLGGIMIGWRARRCFNADQPARCGLEPCQSGAAIFLLGATPMRPCAAVGAKRKAMKNLGKVSNSGVVVIVVSDDLAVRNSLKFWLEIEGLTVRGYVSGADLLDAGDLARCDCYVVDQKTSAVSGLDLIAQLRDRHFTAPAILIASHPSRSLREQAEKADIPIVEKPLLGNGLLDKIRDVVGGRV
jgi:two-component system, LuxR family, response regulator FixJ